MIDPGCGRALIGLETLEKHIDVTDQDVTINKDHTPIFFRGFNGEWGTVDRCVYDPVEVWQARGDARSLRSARTSRSSAQQASLEADEVRAGHEQRHAAYRRGGRDSAFESVSRKPL